ncbi:MAG: bifunctional phosphopantothenoylcysteine decarboxylase/phosphopantothenate--cysteine ligase CoaBC [Synergistaceae bacterium]|nr:bifunctional phosphopantothenoylcysteine decarboxylase/phosphopantothenate--cysteine ligase CoaBC [Synergistaceae bacterium]
MTSWKKGRKILLCITGGIAAYKIPSLVRLVRKSDCEVEIILTKSAKNFVAPMALETLSGREVWTDDDFDGQIPHIRLSQWADVLVVAPCTANTIAKIAHGMADNLLTSTVIASGRPVLIFPAMNEKMFGNPATQSNIETLKARGFRVVQPSSGSLACGDSGKGRMPEPDEILHEILRALCVQDMAGKKVLVTAGPTHEYIDPVRYISNPSTGKMGSAMARSAWYRGADVRIIVGPVQVDSWGMEQIHVTSANEMMSAVISNLPWADYIVKAAAVGDYRAKEISGLKIKREGKESLTLELVSNPDIAAQAGKLKRDSQVLIGFAAETDRISENAKSKLLRKNLDFILANDVTEKDSGFASDTNTLRLISSSGSEEIFSGLKEEISFDVWSRIIAD